MNIQLLCVCVLFGGRKRFYFQSSASSDNQIKSQQIIINDGNCLSLLTDNLSDLKPSI